MRKSTRPPTYGLMAEFDNPSDAVAAARRVHDEGYRRVDAFSPYPVEELSEAIGVHKTHMPLIILLGGLFGGTLGFLMQVYVEVFDFPINVGGKPYYIWPAFIPITFECTILVSALSAVLGMLALNGLPMPYHPVFNVSRFALASRNRFFLCIQATDDKFDLEKTRAFLKEQNPHDVYEVHP